MSACTGAAAVAGAGGDSPAAKAARATIAGALAARGLLGGRVAATVLRLRPPPERFLRLDGAVYRPLCLGLAVAAAVAVGVRPRPRP